MGKEEIVAVHKSATNRRISQTTLHRSRDHEAWLNGAIRASAYSGFQDLAVLWVSLKYGPELSKILAWVP